MLTHRVVDHVREEQRAAAGIPVRWRGSHGNYVVFNVAGAYAALRKRGGIGWEWGSVPGRNAYWH